MMVAATSLRVALVLVADTVISSRERRDVREAAGLLSGAFVGA